MNKRPKLAWIISLGVATFGGIFTIVPLLERTEAYIGAFLFLASVSAIIYFAYAEWERENDIEKEEAKTREEAFYKEVLDTLKSIEKNTERLKNSRLEVLVEDNNDDSASESSTRK